MSDLTRNVNAAHFPSWLSALQRVRDDLGVARIACIGDSTTEGYDAGTLAATYPMVFRDMLVASGIPAVDGAIWAQSAWYTDSRISRGTGWSFWDSTGWGGGNIGTVRSWTATTSATGRLTFTFPHEIDTIRVFYAKTVATGSFTIDIGGPSLGTVNTNSPSGNAAEFTDFTCSSGVQTIRINPPTVGDVYIMGVEAWLSTSGSVLVSNAGSNSVTTSVWATSTYPWSKLSQFDLYQPDLAIVVLGITDAIFSGTSANLKTNLTTIAQKQLLYGDVFLCTMIPSGEEPATSNELLYLPKYAEIADELDLALFDLNFAFVDWLTADSLGWMSDAYHPNASGYAAMAAFIHEQLPTEEGQSSSLIQAHVSGEGWRTVSVSPGLVTRINTENGGWHTGTLERGLIRVFKNGMWQTVQYPENGD